MFNFQKNKIFFITLKQMRFKVKVILSKNIQINVNTKNKKSGKFFL